MNDQSDSIETVTLATAQGRLIGLRSRGIFEFRGIPYAKPPAGVLRWRMPEPVEAWTEVRNATRFGPVCPQAPTPFDTLLGGALSTQSEDCLYLNVYTPGLGGGRRPVMVWIHGGAFVIGAASQSIYDGRHLASREVVVVTINYRLGAFGFLDLSDVSGGRVAGRGAEGLADQLLALDWARRNIEAFGGDPDNVTIFGESAGAMGVAALLASPRSGGLFHKAILQSGAAHIGHDRDSSARVGRAVLDALSLRPEEASGALEAPAGLLVKAQVAVIAAAHGREGGQKLGRLPFQPTVDGQLLPLRPIEALRQGHARGIPVLVGTTREEWKLFSATDPRLRLMSMAGFETRLARMAGDSSATLLKAYASGSAFERYNAVMTDRVFAVPAARLLEALAPAAPAFSYRFDWRSPLLGGIFGSCHALELGFVFGTHGKGAAGAFFGRGRAAEDLAQIMMECWTAFARTGNPATAATGTWPRFDATGRETMIFGDGAPRVVAAPERGRLDAWDAVADRKLGP